ncbi:MAG: M3 family oligoendopeptidase [Alphaproteobacteria bacterium]
MPKSAAVKKAKPNKPKTGHKKSVKAATAKSAQKKAPLKLVAARKGPAAAKSAKGPKRGDLPVWDLSHLYPGPDSPALKSDLAKAQEDAKAFETRYAGTLAKLSGKEFGVAIGGYETIQETLGRIMSYAQLLYAGNVSDPATAQFFQTMQERVTDISSHLLFFTLEINKLEDAALEKKFDAPEAAHYRTWLRDVRAFKPHQLSDEVEKLLHEKSVAGRASWVRLFDETMARLRFPIGGKKLTSAEALHMMSERSRSTRKTAALALGKTLGENVGTFALVTNTLAKDKEVEDRWRKFPHPCSARNLSNFVEDEVVEALAGAVKKSYPRLSHRYYRLKAKWFKTDKLDYWDRNAPLPSTDDSYIPWDEARRRVLESYRTFSPDMAIIAERFFDESWIDAGVRPGKEPGAFSHPTVPSAHPYILMNYQGKARDVMTLAHELGHGVHQVLAGPRGLLMSDTPLTLAETASVFGEMLTFQGLLAAEKNAKTRRTLLAGKVEDMLNTVVRQIAFYDFELRVHTERCKGELTAERISDIWMDVQRESLGPSIKLGGDYRYFWTYIPHFIHSPFYVYAYAFGDCLVNSLYSTFRKAEQGFQVKYLDMLRAGGTKRHKELLAPFGLDATDPAFWDRGLEVVSGFIDELEKL